MTESIEEFFNYDRLMDTNLNDGAALIKSSLEGNTTAVETAQSLTGKSSITSAAVMSGELLDECVIKAAEQLQYTQNALLRGSQPGMRRFLGFKTRETRVGVLFQQ